jgi:GTP-binding protein EngB required for normal cell division
MRNVILFGEAGSGKSSLVNMIVGKDVAKVSNEASGCTFKNASYEATIDNTTFVIYDTAGLNEGDQGRVPHFKAIQELYTLIRRLDGVSLLIYCMRGRVKENSSANWILFNQVICGGKVPTIAVVTGLDDLTDPDAWWRNERNQAAFRSCKIKPNAVGCVVSFPGLLGEYEDVYAKSQEKLRRLIMENHLRKPWSQEKEKWFANIYSETFSSRLCFPYRNRLEMRGLVSHLIGETGMNREDSKKLEATLVRGEKEFRKGFL